MTGCRAAAGGSEPAGPLGVPGGTRRLRGARRYECAEGLEKRMVRDRRHEAPAAVGPSGLEQTQLLEPVDVALHAGCPSAGEADELPQVELAARLRQEDGEQPGSGGGPEDGGQHCEPYFGTIVP